MHDTGFKSDTVKDVKVMLYSRGDKWNGKIKVASLESYIKTISVLQSHTYARCL